MQALTDQLERLPVATLVHLVVTVILGIDLIVNGTLSTDALTYAGIVEGGNGLVGIGRAHLAGQKAQADATRAIAAPTDVADLEPGDNDALNDLPVHNGAVPADTGDLAR